MIKLTTELRETAIAIAQEAGQAIMQIYSNGFDVTLKDDDSPVTAADLAADRVIQQGLRQLLVQIRLSELPLWVQAQTPQVLQQHRLQRVPESASKCLLSPCRQFSLSFLSPHQPEGMEFPCWLCQIQR